MSYVINEDTEHLEWRAGTPLWTASTEFTIACWVKVTAAQWGDIFALVDNGDEGYNNVMLRTASGTAFDHQLNILTTDLRMSSSGSVSGGWDFIALTYKQSANRVSYRNGSAQETSSSSMSNQWMNGQGADTIMIGYANVSGYGQHSGRMKVAHCAVWNKELTSGEIASLYNGGSGGNGVNPQDIQAANLKFYAALDTSKTVDVGGLTLTYTDGGTESYDGADNPTVDAPSGGGGGGGVAGLARFYSQLRGM